MYNFTEIEKKWQKYWEENETFKTDVWDFSKPKYYALDMFPYPSGQGLHVGHPEGYTATDIISRMKRMQGYNVLHPMGFDSFGLPAEQYAIKTGNHPEGFTKKNIETFTKQLKMLGMSFDWSRVVSTCDPSFYKWTQWIFKQLYLDGYAKLVEMPVNWCEELGTVLANDEIIDGKSERGGYPVVRKNMKQWVIDIPKYAERLLDGLNKEDAINKMIEWLEDKKLGTKKVNYRFREWIFARQRYWGEPIPIIHLNNGGTRVLEDDELPLVLPSLEDYSPSKTGASPLEKATEWVNTPDGKRETSTMPGSAGSSWYFLRYIDPHNDKELADKRLLEHWMPVDLYMGGPEHAVGHLLYSRMWNNYLYDKGICPVKEPFKKLRHQGMILGSNGEKMSKSKGNVVNPDEMVNNYGADSLRLYEMFMGPIDAAKPWDPNGIDGAKKFLERIWRLYTEEDKIKDEENKNLEKVYHQTVKKVTEDYETMNFNTAISSMMVFINAVYKENVFPKEYALNFVKLLNPIAPHITEELWQRLGNNDTITYATWPSFDESKMVDETFEMVVQVNGKVRGKIVVSTETSKEEMEKLALDISNVKNYIDGKEIVKIVTIPKKLVSIVVK